MRTLLPRQLPPLLLVLAALGGCGGDPPSCPPALAAARHLVVVTSGSMDSAVASLTTFERENPEAPWRMRSAAEPAVVGEKGLAWGWTFRSLGERNEPLKAEGDKRTPAGIFGFGPTFGFSASSAPGHLRLEKDRHICVDDPKSKHYSRIVSRDEAGAGTSAEEMSTIPVYEMGIVVDYPTDGKARAGSCIFVHIWSGAGQGTSGCIALPRERVADLQAFVTSAPSAIAILPEPARQRFTGCLPLDALLP